MFPTCATCALITDDGWCKRGKSFSGPGLGLESVECVCVCVYGMWCLSVCCPEASIYECASKWIKYAAAATSGDIVIARHFIYYLAHNV